MVRIKKIRKDPQILDNGQIRKFDRVLANPPFSQNYSRASLKFPSRFREWCPETGKKADLMFVQHMLASLKPNGYMATIMPHGVLFRGGKEKLIREILINDDCIEAIISLPPGLFYGTGIPACVIVCNKNKPDVLKDAILFINADKEFAEGKNQNKLRPEDIEKINFVFAQKRELPKYSKFVSKDEIVKKHDYNLNIRRYVDNTPDPELEDVQAHLIGGIPKGEVEALESNFSRFGVKSETLFQSERKEYLAFRKEINTKSAIKVTLDAHEALNKIFTAHYNMLQDWWSVAQNDFARLRDGKKMPEVRHELLTTIKAKLIPFKILDEFKTAGVFVNWWQQIRYDLKTIISTGWHHTLIPDEYLITEFFSPEAEQIETLEARISEAQSELTEIIEDAQEAIAYEPEEGESVTNAVIKGALEDLIKDLENSTGESAKKELKKFKDYENRISVIEKNIKETKAKLKILIDELEFKLQLKRLGSEDFKVESLAMIQKDDAQVATLNATNKDDKKKITALTKDKTILQARIAKVDDILNTIGGQLSESEARHLILKKIYDLAQNELNRYLNSEKRILVYEVENLYAKYFVSVEELENKRSKTIKALEGFLSGLGYLK